MADSTCPWCERPFPPERVGGTDKIFCTARCRNEAHSAKRAFMNELFNNRWQMVRQWQKANCQPCTAHTATLEGEEGVGCPKGLVGAETG